MSKSAPTDLALRLALDQGITVVGFIPMEQLWYGGIRTLNA
ncbi:hypothetical protein [Paenibacillus alginolyticus]|nr:hypothetical protein [Paenibacillus frigoriresistens]